MLTAMREIRVRARRVLVELRVEEEQRGMRIDTTAVIKHPQRERKNKREERG